MVQVSANLHDEKMIGWAMALVLMEKKYGKWLLYLASPRALVWGGVALAQTCGAFCEHWDETLVFAVFKHIRQVW